MRTALTFSFILLSIFCCAQDALTPAYPKGYFRNPLNIPISLSGNFGELRNNHYHMGLDLRTNKVQNLPVVAAADGYIARVKIEPAGFGRAIYINHPNGYTTLYAHLNAFTPALDQYIKEKQYEQESWSVYLEIPPSLFPVKKGSFIAYSGNTGGSQAPHLHFEIRRTSDDMNVNPMLFGFPIPDATAPTILRLAIYDRTKSVYEQTPRILSVKKSGNQFTLGTVPIKVNSRKISFAISAFDTQSGSTNQNGIFKAVLQEDGELITQFVMDTISYNETRYLNAHVDYRTRSTGGPWLQHLSQLPGYFNSIYENGSSNGIIELLDQEIHQISIPVSDAFGNTSILRFAIQYAGSLVGPVSPTDKEFYPGMVDGFESGDCEFFFGERTLYDSVHVRYSKTVSATPGSVSNLHTIGVTHIPLHDQMTVRIRPNRILTEKERALTIMQRSSGLKKDVQKVEWKLDWAKAGFREFGNFQLLVDHEPPEIVPIGFTEGANLSKASRIVLTVKDNNDRFKNFRAELDGSWLRFTNDKGRSFIYNFDEKCPKGVHELRITVEDEAGNKTEKVLRFTR